jgi:hypothetical protein
MSFKTFRESWIRRTLSPLGQELWDSLADEHTWCYPNMSGFGEDPVRTHIEHMQTKIRLAFNFKHDILTVYQEHGTSFHYVLTKYEQKALLTRFRDCTNKALAFQFQIAPFKETNY